MARTILTYGTFDLFHIGHLRLLERARALGDRLIVGVSSDDFNTRKGKRCFVPYAHRAAIVAACRHVDAVFAETDWEQKPADIARLGASVLVMGSDWRGRFDALGRLCEVVYVERTVDISSTELRDQVHRDVSGIAAELAHAADLLADLGARVGQLR